MGKNKNKKWQNQSATQTPTSASEPVRQEPTAEQIGRLEKAGAEMSALTSEHGPPLPVAVPEPVGVTLEESLKRVEGLLSSAKALFEKARAHEISREQLRKDLEAAKKDANEDIAAKKGDIEQSELKVLEELEAIEKREADLGAKEAKLADDKRRLTERELNADQGFRAERTAVFKPLEEELSRLREERARLESDLLSLRERTHADERARANERDARWAQQEAERIASDAEARRLLESEVAKARHDGLAKLHDELKAERDRWEAEWRVELERCRELLNAREAELEGRERQLIEKTKAHRAAHLEIQAAQEILQEDRAGVDKKVQRLVAERTEALRHEAEAFRKQLQDARGQRDSYFKELESRRELDRQLRGQSPEKILADVDALERERRSLQQQLRERPDTGAGNRVSALERERSAWLEERALLQADLAKAQGELATRRLAAIELEALRKQKEALEVHKQLLDGAVDELRARVDELTRQDDHRNPMTSLASLDDREELKVEARTTTPFGRATPTLREFAEDLRHRIATGVKDRTLYYTQRDVRSFLAGLATTRLLLLQGISGTGKTSLPLAFVAAVDAGVEIVEVQAGWRDRQDLVGYYNAFHRHYYATNFLQALYKAGTPQYRDRFFVMVLDEINLSRPEQFFADFLSALEQPLEKRRLTLLNDPLTNAPRLMIDGRHLPIPPNVWFVGTANHDESTAEFADKTYDRAHVMELPRKTDAAHFAVGRPGPRNAISYEKLMTAFAEATEKQAKGVQAATTWLRKAEFTKTLAQRFRVGWGNRLEHQLGRYLPVIVESGGTLGEAMDHLLATKVLRKLKDRHDVRAAALEELSTQLQVGWEALDKANPPERCVALIDNEIALKKGEELV